MARPKNTPTGSQSAVWRTAIYTRLSREDGDKPDSDSIINQTRLLEDYIRAHPELTAAARYSDDGYTGTNFNRPDFQRMLRDIEAGRINCVLVKDLSRFGRDYIDVGRYLERFFPDHQVRFIAVSDGIDSEHGPYDMLLPVKNIFNEQYARDISKKVRSAVRTKQSRGDFIGAFASYGYIKDPGNHNHLLVDPPAAAVVRRIFALCQSGTGQLKIAKQLNADGIPCPSEYKRLSGQKYHNGQKLGATTYWTYATVHRILRNQLYTGAMVQGRSPRQGMHGPARKADKSQWSVVSGTHQAIISREQWQAVQALLDRPSWQPEFDRNRLSPFAGFLRCGDCGRAMCKTHSAGGTYYCCGSYKRYGSSVCSRHGISEQALADVVLNDLNQVIASIQDLNVLADEARPKIKRRDLSAEQNKLSLALARVRRLKQSSYEDYKDGLLEQKDFLRYQADYQRQEEQLTAQLELLSEHKEEPLDQPWVTAFLKQGKLTQLDRATVAEAVREILIFEDNHIEITYNFEDEAKT